MTHANKTKIALGVALALQVPAIAGPTEAPPVEPAPASNPGDWCAFLQNAGSLYKNKENPYIQEFKIEGRLQFQMATLNGEDVNGGDWSSNFNEFRRFRLGGKAKFLQYFGVKGVVDLVNDERVLNEPNEGLEWGYQQWDEGYVSFDLGKALKTDAFETLELKYGRQKFVLGSEARESSKNIYTIERSAISNKVYGSYRPTGLTLEGESGPWSFAASLYSSTTDGTDNEGFNGWQDSVIYLLGAGYQVNDELKLYADWTYNAADVTDGDDSVMDYAWASSISALYDAGKWGVNGDLIYGDNGGARLGNGSTENGDFWGVVVLPYYWLVDEKLQLVGQYQYAGAESSEGMRINSRYGRDRGTGGLNNVDVNSGRGDNHNSFYAGLNYYLCGQNAKVQAGVEFQTMDTPVGDFNTTTYLLAFRTFF